MDEKINLGNNETNLENDKRSYRWLILLLAKTRPDSVPACGPQATTQLLQSSLGNNNQSTPRICKHGANGHPPSCPCRLSEIATSTIHHQHLLHHHVCIKGTGQEVELRKADRESFTELLNTTAGHHTSPTSDPHSVQLLVIHNPCRSKEDYPIRLSKEPNTN